ncbi:hypothetical protein BC938DRAFT_472429 [Jimgerdemannia flammicorona]|uniref:Heat shock protein 70 family n=1 Tax=Jimgerdemannia flammicorona TaxID=994334 RepID=A0A433QZX0_9FUNG|nr:hypothetical protein BC938DRAFT_472429 [Jimgerdemannia flammicorona]
MRKSPFMSNPEKNIFSQYSAPTTAKCVAAIDFGTSGTGFAYAFPPSNGEIDPKSDIFQNGEWPDGTTGKTKTALLLDDENKFVAFGRSAQMMYKPLALKGKGKFFQFFKMDLYTQEIDGELQVKAQDGKSLPVKIVFAESLKFIRNCKLLSCPTPLAFQKLKLFLHIAVKFCMTGNSARIPAVLLKQIRSTSYRIAPDEIKWVLTVPTIWGDAAKQIMSEAANMAGLGTDGGHDLLLALEAEAASLWCLKSGNIRMNDGNQYMVVDAGGGTVDVLSLFVLFGYVTVHEKYVTQAGDSVKEVAPANGGSWGSSTIDQRVFKLLEDIFGKDRFEATKKDINGYIKLQEDVESSKCRFDGNTDVILVLPNVLTGVLGIDHYPTANSAVEAYSEATKIDFVIKGSNMLIPAKYFREQLMGPIIKITVQHVSTIIQKCDQIRHVILVGNFANCTMLQEEIQLAVSSKDIKVIIPNCPGEAVMKGAVLFGINPGVVVERVSRFTYGVNLSKPFDQALHPQEKLKLTKDGRAYCVGVFDTLVRAGQPLVLGYTVERTYEAMENDQKQITFRIYSSPRPDPKFIDDFKAKEIGTVTIRVSQQREM